MIQVICYWPRGTVGRRVLPEVLELLVDPLERHSSMYRRNVDFDATSVLSSRRQKKMAQGARFDRKNIGVGLPAKTLPHGAPEIGCGWHRWQGVLHIQRLFLRECAMKAVNSQLTIYFLIFDV